MPETYIKKLHAADNCESRLSQTERIFTEMCKGELGQNVPVIENFGKPRYCIWAKPVLPSLRKFLGFSGKFRLI